LAGASFRYRYRVYRVIHKREFQIQIQGVQSNTQKRGRFYFGDHPIIYNIMKIKGFEVSRGPANLVKFIIENFFP